MGRELSLGRWTTVSLFNRAFESLVVSCLDRLEFDRVVVTGVGGGVRVLNKGSDSPSKVAALVSWRSDEVSGTRVRGSGLIGAAEVRLQCEEDLE